MRERAGLTLIELLVAIAGLLVVLIIIYRIYDETQQASVNMTRRHSGIDHAVRVVDEAGELIASAVNPAALDDAAGAEAAFEKNRLVLPIHRAGEEGGWRVVTIAAAQGEGASHFEIQEKAIGDTGEPIARELGGKIEGIASDIQFRYALDATPGAAIEYMDSLRAGEWPALIEVLVSVRTDPKDPNNQPIELRSSFMPGRMPKSAVQAEVAPAAAPAANPESAAPNPDAAAPQENPVP
jgi:hypothetical protein